MEAAAYRLLYDNIHDFKETVVHVESEIRRYGIRDNGKEDVSGCQCWVKNTRSFGHFYLGIDKPALFERFHQMQ
ncbi:hypothetical protein F4212_08930 [Candidatus Poribacteria bacterium]|nr:hypothetical protein [Candidatus Poribacteria bacterium]